MKSTHKYVLVTGATEGIGYELAKLFARERLNLILVARSETELQARKQEFEKEQIEVVTMAKDLFEPNAATEIYEEVRRNGYHVDVLVNNAGQGVFGKFVENELERELRLVQLNVASMITLTKPILRDMVERGSGKILNLSSIAGKIPGPYQAVYHGTKSFVQSFTAAVRSEVEGTGVTLTALLPGVTDTDFFNKADMEDSKILDGDIADPAKVAKDGYKAVMAGEAQVISGFKNKMQVAMGSVTPDKKAADTMGKIQKPKRED